MPRTYPDTQAGVNDQEEPKPNYYAIIPASVRYCKELQPAAKLLFGELVALTTTRGYCFAQNPYFMALYGVDRSTVQRWLASLADRGFIQVDYDAATNERRIYVNAMQIPGVPQKQGGGAAKMPHPRRKNAAHSITENITKSNTTTLNVGDKRFVGPGPVPAKELKEQEGKGSASPPLLERRSRDVEEVVKLTGDENSVKRFRQLWNVADGSSYPEAWQGALDALKHAASGSAGPVERPGAYFCSVLVSALNLRGVAVPVGSASERRSVKSQIASSFAAAGSEAAE